MRRNHSSGCSPMSAFLGAQHRLPARREVHRVGDEVPVPEPVVGAAHREREALLALAQRRLGLLPRQLVLDARHREGKVDGLRHVVVGAQSQRLDHVAAVLLCRDHDDGQLDRREAIAERRQDLDAAHARHLDVEQHQRERLFLDPGERPAAVLGDDDGIAGALQASRQHVAVHLVVVDHEQRSGRRRHRACSVPSRPSIFSSSRCSSTGLVSYSSHPASIARWRSLVMA